MNLGVKKSTQAPCLAKKFVSAKRTADLTANGKNSSEVRRRLLKMIKDNEQKRHSDISTPLGHR